MRLWGVAKLIGLCSIAVGLLGCGGGKPLPFTNVPVEIPQFTDDVVTTTSVMRVGNNIEETVVLPKAKMEDVEKAIARLKKQGWRQLHADMQVNSWDYILEKDGIQVEMLYRAGRGATVTARRRADVKQE